MSGGGGAGAGSAGALLAGGGGGAGAGAGAGCACAITIGDASASQMAIPTERRISFPHGLRDRLHTEAQIVFSVLVGGEVGAHRRVVDDLHLDVDLVIARDVDGETRAL